MEHRNYRSIFTLIISILLVCAFCLTAFAEGTAAGAENGAAAEAADKITGIAESMMVHHLWGFFTHWAEGDTATMAGICSYDWRKGKENPGQALREVLGSARPHGYAVNGFSGKNGDPVRTADITLQWETEQGDYRYSRYEIALRKDWEGYYYLDPDGFTSGVPAEPVPEEELVLLTAESIVRQGVDMHDENGLSDRLVPINAVTEKQGIRVEVISGLAKGNKAWFVISVQDTEGKYSGYDLSAQFLENLDQRNESWSMKLFHDEKENKDYFFLHQDLEQPVKAEDGNGRVGVESIWVEENEMFSLLPLLKQYGKAEEGISPPELETRNSYSRDGAAVPEDLKILDYTQPLDVSLFRSWYLTGIGWIGNQLHVQFHNRGQEYIDLKNGRATGGGAWVDCAVAGKPYGEAHVDYSPLNWDGDDDGWEDWREYIFNCSPEEAELLDADVNIWVVKEILQDSWTVEVPLDRIVAEADPEPEKPAADQQEPAQSGGEADKAAAEDMKAFPAIKDDHVLYRLWEFFCDWAQADMDRLPFVLTEAEKYAGEEMHKRVWELLAEGTPLAFQVNGVERKNGGEYRNYTCTVLIDQGGGEEPRCRQYMIPLKFEDGVYYVELGSVTSSPETVEMAPEARTISLSAETIISDQLDMFFPGVREGLQPVGLNCEMTGGIRMELISGLVKDYESWFLYSLQDPDGKHDDCSVEVFHMKDDIGTTRSHSSVCLYRDRKEHKAYMLWNPHYKERIDTGDRTVRLSLNSVGFTRNVWEDLTWLLKQYGKEAGGVQLPEGVVSRHGSEEGFPEGLMILDRTRQPDVPLLDNAAVTGIGWIDGLLHVQIHLTKPSSWSVFFDYRLQGESGNGNRKELPYSPLEWWDGEGEWLEYVFDYRPEDADNLILNCSMSVGQGNERGTWEFDFPLSSVLPEDAPAEQGTIVYDPEAGGCVYTLNGIRYLLKGDGTADVLENCGTEDTVPEVIAFAVNGTEGN